MGASRSWFKVHARMVLAQGQQTLAQLSAPENTRAVLDLSVIGMNGAEVRHALDTELGLLSDRLDAQEEASRWAEEVREEVRSLSEAAFSWRQRLIARLRYAATCGADPERRFGTAFGYRKLPRARARGLLLELPRLFAVLASYEASLRPHGIDGPFVDEGQLHHARLRQAQQELDSAVESRKAATRAVGLSHRAVRDRLLQLTAADEAAALEFGRRPCFSLDLLQPTARTARVSTSSCAPEG